MYKVLKRRSKIDFAPPWSGRRIQYTFSKLIIQARGRRLAAQRSTFDPIVQHLPDRAVVVGVRADVDLHVELLVKERRVGAELHGDALARVEIVVALRDARGWVGDERGLAGGCACSPDAPARRGC